MESNQEYVEARKTLIPIAEKHADLIAGEKPPSGKSRTIRRIKEAWENKWNFAFHTKMNELYKMKEI